MDLERRDTQRGRGWMVAMLCMAAITLAGPPVSAGSAAGSADAERMGRELRGYVVRTLDGRPLALGSLQGEVVVVNFWASWCGPCRKELPRLDALHASMAGKGGRVVAISIDEEPRNVARFVKTLKLSLPVYRDGPDGLARKLDLPSVPFTVVLDRGGAVAFTTSGADARALDAIADAARRLMAGTPGESSTIAGGTP